MRKYEELITDLKEIVKKIENNETNLDEMIVLYEQGIDANQGMRRAAE